MPARMTATAYGQGVKNALACGAGLLSVCALGGLAIWLVTGMPFHESFGVAFGVILVLVFAWFFVAWLYGRNFGGEVLLDCGPHPMRKLFLLNAVIFLVIGVTSGLAASSPSQVFAVGGPVFGITFALYWVVLATGRLQIRESGIWTYWALMRWEKIGSYYWGKDSTLFFKGKGWLASVFSGAIPVAPEQRETFEELLQRKCSTTYVA
jgi:hypothetical protein